MALIQVLQDLHLSQRWLPVNTAKPSPNDNFPSRGEFLAIFPACLRARRTCLSTQVLPGRLIELLLGRAAAVPTRVADSSRELAPTPQASPVSGLDPRQSGQRPWGA